MHLSGPTIWTQAYFLLQAPSVPKVHGARSLSLQKGDRGSLGPLLPQLPKAGRLAPGRKGLREGGPLGPQSHSRSRWLGRAGPKSQRTPAPGHLLPLSRPERRARPSDVPGDPPRGGFGSARAPVWALRFIVTLVFPSHTSQPTNHSITMSPQEPQAQKTCPWQPGSLSWGRGSEGPEGGPAPQTLTARAQESTRRGYSLVLLLQSCAASDKYPYLSDPLLL